jgi:hypothetical protein
LTLGFFQSSLQALFAAIASGKPDAFSDVPGIIPKILAALGIAEQGVFAGAMKMVFLATIAFGSAEIIASFFIKNIDHLLTSEVIRKLHKRDVHTITEVIVEDKQVRQEV